MVCSENSAAAHLSHGNDGDNQLNNNMQAETIKITIMISHVFDHFGRLWEASGVLWGLLLGMKIWKFTSGAQNDPKLAQGEFCAHVPHPF